MNSLRLSVFRTAWALACMVMISDRGAFGAAGDIDVSFTGPKINYSGTIHSIVPEADGKALMVGSFTNLDGSGRQFLARLKPDWLLDAGFSSAVVGGFISSASPLPDGRIVVGGGFTNAASPDHLSLAELSSSGAPNVAVQGLTNLSIGAVGFHSDGRLVAMGVESTNFDVGVLLRIGASGGIDPAFTNRVTGRLLTMAVQDDGRILIGGSNLKVAGVQMPGIARLLPDGSLDASFNQQDWLGRSGYERVSCIAVQGDGKILVGGVFDLTGSFFKLLRLNSDGSQDQAFRWDVYHEVRSVAVQVDGKILVGGDLHSIGGNPVKGVARLNQDGSYDSSFHIDLNQLPPAFDVYSVAIQADGKVLVAGAFDFVSQIPKNNILRLLNDSGFQRIEIADGGRIRWMRGGTAPEVSQVVFEVSTNAGVSWGHLGRASRVTGGWELSRLALPSTGTIRAWGRTTAGRGNASSGVAESRVEYQLPQIRSLSPFAGDRWRIRFNGRQGVPYSVLSSVSLGSALTDWTTLGVASEVSPGEFEYIDVSGGKPDTRFYSIRWP